MIGYFHITPKSRAALDAVTKHGGVMGVDRQKGVEVLLWCATPTCPCWQKHRYRNWFRINTDVVLGSSVALDSVQAELASAVPI